jgi:hypothetical protein
MQSYFYFPSVVWHKVSYIIDFLYFIDNFLYTTILGSTHFEIYCRTFPYNRIVLKSAMFWV